jgi:hypothetical protein
VVGRSEENLGVFFIFILFLFKYTGLTLFVKLLLRRVVDALYSLKLS